MNRMNPRYKFGIWLGMRNNSAECCIVKADGVFRVREIRRLQPQSRWDKKVIKNVIGVLRRKTDGRWTVGRPEIRANPIPIPPLPLEGTRFQSERVNKQDIDESTQSKTENGWKPTLIVAEFESKNASASLGKKQKHWIDEVR